MQPELRGSIARGLTYLCTAQQGDGRFMSFSSSRLRPFQAQHTYSTTFAPALILLALADIPEAAAIRGPLARWLVAQRGPLWSFNYWASDEPQRQIRPYPDDLDDTFCAVAALYRHDHRLVDASALGSIVRLLLAAENQIGGPYSTWLVPPEADAHWKDVDVAVNANIAYFLQLVAQPLPNLTAFMERAILSGKPVSPYYPDSFGPWYYLARSYHGPALHRLRSDIVRRRRQGHWATPLNTALALNALRRTGAAEDAGPALQYLLSQQQPDGSWPAEAFCIDPARDGKQYYGGAAALTTAFVLEALHPYSLPPVTPAVAPRPDQAARTLYDTVVAQATDTCRGLPGRELRQSAQATLQHMLRGDHNQEIILLPLLFARSLASSVPHPGPTLLNRLSLANLWGWTAYTLYDDFLDSAGDIRMLPVANTTLRLSHDTFLAAAPESPEYQQLVRSTFTLIDAANAWEVAQCRLVRSRGRIAIAHLPRYGSRMQLAERSLGHALSAMAILADGGTAPTDPRAQQVLLALQHYLIARQLGDDLCDWEADLRAGICTYVVGRILQDLHVKPGEYLLSRLLPRMRRMFAQRTLASVSRTLLRHTRTAQGALRASTLIAHHSPLDGLLDALAAQAIQQLADQTDTKAFLAAYRQKLP